MIEKESIFKAWTIDLHERFPHWPYKKPKPGHEGFRLLDGPAPDFRRMTVEEFETLPAGVWMDVKRPCHPWNTRFDRGRLRQLPHPHRIHRHPGGPVLHHLQRRPFLAADCMEQVRAVETRR